MADEKEQASDPTRSTLFTTEEAPGLAFRLRPVLTTPYNWAVDRAWRKDDVGKEQFDTRAFFGWLLRFGTEEIEGVTWPKGEIPKAEETMRLMTDSYPLLTGAWFDRIPPRAVVEVGIEIQKRSQLTGSEKKT